MIEMAMHEWKIDISKSILVGDQATDLLAAKKVGIDSIQFAGGDLFTVCVSALQARHHKLPDPRAHHHCISDIAQ